VKGSATVGGPNGHRSNGSEIEGRPNPQLKPGGPDGGARRGPDGAGQGATSSSTSFLNATSSATSFLNAMSPVSGGRG
jgi:hypothetical protein